MAPITLKTIKDINSKCSNGFQFDISDYRELGDKNLSKSIKIDEKKQIKATLFFRDEIIEHRETGRRIPTLNVSIWTKCDESAMLSSGLGHFHYFKEKTVSRRSIWVLQELTKEITDEMIKGLAVDNANDSIYKISQSSSNIIES